jgi:hypothetical protein
MAGVSEEATQLGIFVLEFVICWNGRCVQGSKYLFGFTPQTKDVKIVVYGRPRVAQQYQIPIRFLAV